MPTREDEPMDHSPDDKAFLLKLIQKFNPAEFEFMGKITSWIEEGKNRPKSLDSSVSEEFEINSTEATLLRSGITARMLELGLISRIKEGREVTFLLTSGD